MAPTFTYHRGGWQDYEHGDGWEMTWNGADVTASLLEACRRAINEVAQDGYQMAKHEHIWDNETGQTEEAVFLKDAEIELLPYLPENPGPHVWGEWGVQERPRFHMRDDGSVDTELPSGVSTTDVALWLEFGTVKMEPRPWLYPAWDATKVQLPAAVAKWYAIVKASGAPGLRDALGRFRSMYPGM